VGARAIFPNSATTHLPGQQRLSAWKGSRQSCLQEQLRLRDTWPDDQSSMPHLMRLAKA
ncbi:unnamed protein product, partial [Closterium sp. Yama58-4]